MTIRIANGAGFLGDSIDAPRRLVEAAQVDYLTLEHLAELTLSILARQREKNPLAGYAGDFPQVLASLTPALRSQPQLRIVTNAGGMNPLACAAAAGDVLRQAGLGDVNIGVVCGDDLLPRLDQLQAAGCDLQHFDTGQPLAELQCSIVSANAYLGAAPIAEALSRGARIVITGRVADASLTVGPAVHEFGWGWNDWDKLAGASVAGHLIECGAQVTGGYSDDWRDAHLSDVGYPIAELSSDAAAVITKPAGTGGRVDRLTVIQQLVYEIGDPQNYLTPDVSVDFTTVKVAEDGANRVRVHGASGRPAPQDLKVSLAYRDGFTASAELLVFGRDCVDKAHCCAEIVLARLRDAGIELQRTHVECLGVGDAVPGWLAAGSAKNAPAVQPPEVVLRIAVHDQRREAVERFTKEIAPLITSGPAGLAGYAAPRSPVRPVFAFWPTTIDRSLVQPTVDVRTAADWEVS